MSSKTKSGLKKNPKSKLYEVWIPRGTVVYDEETNGIIFIWAKDKREGFGKK